MSAAQGALSYVPGDVTIAGNLTVLGTGGGGGGGAVTSVQGGTGITTTPAGGTGDVIVANDGVLSLLVPDQLGGPDLEITGQIVLQTERSGIAVTAFTAQEVEFMPPTITDTTGTKVVKSSTASYPAAPAAAAPGTFTFADGGISVIGGTPNTATASTLTFSPSFSLTAPLTGTGAATAIPLGAGSVCTITGATLTVDGDNSTLAIAGGGGPATFSLTAPNATGTATAIPLNVGSVCAISGSAVLTVDPANANNSTLVIGSIPTGPFVSGIYPQVSANPVEPTPQPIQGECSMNSGLFPDKPYFGVTSLLVSGLAVAGGGGAMSFDGQYLRYVGTAAAPLTEPVIMIGKVDIQAGAGITITPSGNTGASTFGESVLTIAAGALAPSLAAHDLTLSSNYGGETTAAALHILEEETGPVTVPYSCIDVVVNPFGLPPPRQVFGVNSVGDVQNTGGFASASNNVAGTINFAVDGSTGDVDTAGYVHARTDLAAAYVGSGVGVPQFTVSSPSGDIETQGSAIIHSGIEAGFSVAQEGAPSVPLFVVESLTGNLSSLGTARFGANPNSGSGSGVYLSATGAAEVAQSLSAGGMAIVPRAAVPGGQSDSCLQFLPPYGTAQAPLCRLRRAADTNFSPNLSVRLDGPLHLVTTGTAEAELLVDVSVTAPVFRSAMTDPVFQTDVLGDVQALAYYASGVAATGQPGVGYSFSDGVLFGVDVESNVTAATYAAAAGTGATFTDGAGFTVSASAVTADAATITTSMTCRTASVGNPTGAIYPFTVAANGDTYCGTRVDVGEIATLGSTMQAAVTSSSRFKTLNKTTKTSAELTPITTLWTTGTSPPSGAETNLTCVAYGTSGSFGVDVTASGVGYFQVNIITSGQLTNSDAFPTVTGGGYYSAGVPQPVVDFVHSWANQSGILQVVFYHSVTGPSSPRFDFAIF